MMVLRVQLYEPQTTRGAAAALFNMRTTCSRARSSDTFDGGPSLPLVAGAALKTVCRRA